MPDGVTESRCHRAVRRAVRARRRTTCTLMLVFLAAGMVGAAWYLNLPGAAAAVFWAAVAVGTSAVGFLVWFVVALFGDLVLYPRGRRGTRRRPVRAQV